MVEGRHVLAYTHAGVKKLTIGEDVPWPHCFVDADRRVEAPGLVGEVPVDLRHFRKRTPVKRLDFEAPARVRDARDIFIGYSETYEADVPYVRRLFTDGVLVADYAGGHAFVDIEVDDSRGFPRPGVSRVLSIAYSLAGGKIGWMYWRDFDGGDTEMVAEFRRLLESRGITVLVGWNVGFD
ncbi:MAG: hypothetical protein QXD60_03095, partial [Nanopusillaceae archaeon]